MRSQALAKNTQKVYAAAWRSFKRFYIGLHARSPRLPIKVRDIEYYIAHMSQLGKSADTARVHLSALAHKLRSKGYSTRCVHAHRVREFLQGMRRSSPGRKARKHFTVHHMSLLCKAVSKLFHTAYEIAMFRCILLTAFFALLRVSEYTISHSSPHRRLLCKHVRVAADGSFMRVFIESSKTDQFSKGVSLFIGRASGNCRALCPVQAMLWYKKLRGPGHGVLFRWQNGKAVSSTCFGRILKQLLCLVHLDTKLYSPHSLRSGGCTALAGKVPTWKLKAIGRWRSSCVERYIRIPRRELTSYVREMTSGF